MRLTRVRIREFKSVLDSGEFEVEDVTCLVGKNEAGKTAILHALYRLNPIIEKDARFDVTEDFPRLDVEDYEQDVTAGKRQRQAEAVSATFVLSVDEMAPVIAKFGDNVLATSEVVLTRGYDPKPMLYVTVKTNDAAAVKALVRDGGLPKDVAANAAKQPTLDALLKHLTGDAEKRQQDHQAAVAAANTQADANAKTEALSHAGALKESDEAKQLRAELAKILLDKTLGMHIWRNYLQASFPKFLYFDEYYQMTGQVNVQTLKQRQAADELENSDRPMLGLIELARLNLDQLVSPQNTQFLKNKLQGASNHLSGKILKYWSQNKHLHVQFDLRPALPGDPEGMNTSGTFNLWGEVYDSAHGATVRLGTRSRGFVWFFSFLAWFSQQQRKNIPIILLLDEPGLVLHASAQSDLLRYIEEELQPHHQVIYTTHSPFMIDPKRFDRVRIVRDRTMEEDETLPRDRAGTKVFSDVLEADPDSLFPLQGALGYDIAQTLFVGPNSLVIEGASDLVYLPVLSDVLNAANRRSLDERWTLTPVGGADKVHTFVALLGAQKALNIAALLDIQSADSQKIENLYKKKLLKKKQVLTFADFTGTTEADIEDMFTPDFFLELVNGAYKAHLSKGVKPSDLKSHHPRILVRLTEYFKSHPLLGGVKFNHFAPARYLAQNVGTLGSKIDTDTLQRFEAVFKALNALL